MGWVDHDEVDLSFIFFDCMQCVRKMARVIMEDDSLCDCCRVGENILVHCGEVLIMFKKKNDRKENENVHFIVHKRKTEPPAEPEFIVDVVCVSYVTLMAPVEIHEQPFPFERISSAVLL